MHAGNDLSTCVQEGRGCAVRVKSWTSTRHVEHYRHDPEAYIAAIDSFLIDSEAVLVPPVDSSDVKPLRV